MVTTNGPMKGLSFPSILFFRFRFGPPPDPPGRLELQRWTLSYSLDPVSWN